MRRRDFLRAVTITSGAVVLAPPLLRPVGATPAQSTGGGYGSIDGATPDENGLLLPEGFTSRVLARSDEVVDGTDFTWPIFPDGAATFAGASGGWFLVVNSENPVEGTGGASALEFDADGEIIGAYSVLEGTTMNCAGGPTPWGTWLSGEEIEGGLVWECDPTAAGNGTALPALGAFVHEAVAVDPDDERLYLTEDRPDGRLYRFTPDAYPDLGSGTLSAAAVDDDGVVSWLAIPDPSAADTPTREQVPESTPFDGGEGIWFYEGSVYFTTKGDDHVRRLDTAAQTIEVIYDGTGDLTGADNITVEPGTGELFVAEDGGNMEIVIVEPDGTAVPFLRVVDEGVPPDGIVSECTGPVFSPDGTRLFFGSQRGGPDNRGVSYEVTGPFRGAAAAAGTTTTRGVPASGEDGDEGGDDGSDLALPLVGGAMAVGLAVTGAAVWRARTRSANPSPDEPAGESDTPGSR